MDGKGWPKGKKRKDWGQRVAQFNRKRKGEKRKGSIFYNKHYYRALLYLLYHKDKVHTYNSIKKVIKKSTWENRLKPIIWDKKEGLGIINSLSIEDKRVYSFKVNEIKFYELFAKYFRKYFEENILKTAINGLLLMKAIKRERDKIQRKINYINKKSKDYQKVLGDFEKVKEKIIDMLICIQITLKIIPTDSAETIDDTVGDLRKKTPNELFKICDQYLELLYLDYPPTIEGIAFFSYLFRYTLKDSDLRDIPNVTLLFETMCKNAAIHYASLGWKENFPYNEGSEFFCKIVVLKYNCNLEKLKNNIEIEMRKSSGGL